MFLDEGGAMLTGVRAAADELAAEGIDACVLDLRWLRPLDEEAIAAAVVDGGGRVLVVHEAVVSGGFGAEVAAGITERHFDELAAPVQRLGAPDVRMTSAPVLQRAVVPGRGAIIAAARELVHATAAARVPAGA
jgi:2-oxoisovalerate dehydrogenase E1 component